MSHLPDRPCWLFVVDTTIYAGNFDREMIAWTTGAIGGCGMGEEQARVARRDADVSSIPTPLLFPDEHGCRRPATVWPTPGWFNDGLGNHWPNDADPAAVVARYDEAVREEAEHIRKVYDHKPKYGEREANTWLREHLGTPGRYPSYQSVAVGFAEEPSEATLDILVRRTRDFCTRTRKRMSKPYGPYTIPLIGMRLVRWVSPKDVTTVRSFPPGESTR